MCAAILHVDNFLSLWGVCVHLPDLTYSKDRFFGVCWGSQIVSLNTPCMGRI